MTVLAALRVMVLGLRGFPDVEGGVERHAEHLYPRLAELGCSINVVVRSPYHPKTKSREYRGVRLTPLWAPGAGPLEALIHTLLGTLYAGVMRPDLLHIHAIGPSMFAPLARLLGLRVVVTHHGPDYDREKWSDLAKGVLRVAERLGMRFASRRIAISQTIQNLIRQHHRRDCVLIPNGVDLPELPRSCDRPRELGLTPGKYVLLVSRFVPEKRHLDLLKAFDAAQLPGWKIALVGRIDESDEYTREVKRLAAAIPNVVLTGFQKGRALDELYANAGLFVLPSSHEGLPIALLEALSFGLRAIASDIPAHIELGLPDDSYFPVGDVCELTTKLVHFAVPVSLTEKVEREVRLRCWVEARYDWKTIAERTSEVFNDAVA